MMGRQGGDQSQLFCLFQHRFERMRLRGLCGARDEFHLAAIVQNLKTLANRLSQPPPNLAAAYSA
jgi:IS5 family transposase